jgi:endo-1,4-beta-xylanase
MAEVMHNYRSSLTGLNALWFASCPALTTLAHVTEPATRAKPFEWKSSEPLIKPPADARQIHGVKDPTIV